MHQMRVVQHFNMLKVSNPLYVCKFTYRDPPPFLMLKCVQSTPMVPCTKHVHPPTHVYVQMDQYPWNLVYCRRNVAVAAQITNLCVGGVAKKATTREIVRSACLSSQLPDLSRETEHECSPPLTTPQIWYKGILQFCSSC